MSDVKWIKIVVNIFDDEKIKYIESMPNGDGLIVIWFKLLCLAGKSNSFGYLMFTNKMPYTEEMLASIFNRDIKEIQLALFTFQQLDMVEIEDNRISIANWEKHQNIEGMEKIREQTRKRVQEHRERKKLIGCNVTVTPNVTQCNATDIDIDKEIELDKEKDKEKDIKEIKDDVQSVQEPIEPPIIQLILNDKSLFDITKDYYEECCELYPNVDVMQQFRNMKGWLNSNPTKRKTKRGIKKFINSWLSREQDKPRYNQPIRQEQLASCITEKQQPQELSVDDQKELLELRKNIGQVTEEEYNTLMNDIEALMNNASDSK